MRNLVLAVSLTMVAASFASAADVVDFATDVLPILEARCFGCHTADDAEGEFVMDSFAPMMKGGSSGIAITPGSPSSSRMLLMAQGKLEPIMPPEGEEPCTEAELETLSAWIEQGAVGPSGDMPIKREIRTPKISPKPGQEQPVTAIAISAKAGLQAWGRYGSVQIINSDGSLGPLLSDQVNKVNSIQFSRDGKRLLVASGATGAYGNALLFSCDDGKLIREYLDHRDVLYSAAFSPDESIIATAGYDRQIILWDAESGEPIRSLKGHNGAIFDLAFSPDGKVLVSACADETVKVWNVATGLRLDTLSQPEGEVYTVAITSDGKHVLAGSADNRLRVWALRSIERPQINPIIATRFVDESPLVNLQLSPDGLSLLVLSASGNVKQIDTRNWNQAATLEPLGETGSDAAISADGHTAFFALMNGRVAERKIPTLSGPAVVANQRLAKVYMDLGDPASITENELRQKAKSSSAIVRAEDMTAPLHVPRGVTITGEIEQPNGTDFYQWQARAGEVWAIDGDASKSSQIDPIVTIFGSDQQPVLRIRLKAVRDSYFTFRGKDSKQIGDFRIFNWQEMHLDDYLYAAGEVSRLFMHPRGPDSGFNVYPNEGQRWAYFGTSQATHALGEPAYIVTPLKAGEEPVANGLPVFDIYYENDDDPMRTAGKNSRLIFHAPEDGLYTCRITDTRSSGGENFGYQLKIRPAAPSFKATVAPIKGALRRGAGREFRVRVDRFDEFDGPVTFDLVDLPNGLVSNFPVTIEAGQRYADGVIWISETIEAWEGKQSAKVIARAEVAGRLVEREVGSVGDLTIGEIPSIIPSIQPLGGEVAENESWTLSVRRGETVSARIVVRRKEGFVKEVNFGKENAGRNTSHGVYVDNIGLNGLLVRANEDEREFNLTADPVSQPGKRTFFLTGNVDGNISTHPIVVEVLP